MNFPRPIEWEIRGFLLIHGKPCDSSLGHGFGRSEPEAIAHWKQKKLSGWAREAGAVYGIPAPIFRVNRIVAALALLGSLALTSEPAWGVSFGNTLEIHGPSPRAVVREGAIYSSAGAEPATGAFDRTSIPVGRTGSSILPTAAIFLGGSRREAQERTHETNRTKSLTVTADELKAVSDVYANDTHGAPYKRDAKCVTAGETAPFAPAVGGKRSSGSMAESEQTGYLQACQAGSSSDGYSGVDESHLSDIAGGSPAPISPTASEATPTPRFNCRAENRLRRLRESEDTAADGGRFNL